MVKCMKLKFEKYLEEYSDILAVAAVLDPRLKFELTRKIRELVVLLQQLHKEKYTMFQPVMVDSMPSFLRKLLAVESLLSTYIWMSDFLTWPLTRN
ncbi:unnamed protein product [Brassica oleracea]